MKKFNEYLELVSESVRVSSRRIVKKKSSSFQGSSEVATLDKDVDKIITNMNDKINRSFLKVKSSESFSNIVEGQYFNFESFNKHYDENYQEKKDKDILSIISESKDIYDLFKNIFNVTTINNYESLPFEVLSVLDQKINIKDKNKIKKKNLATAIFERIVDEKVKKVLFNLLPETIF